MFRANSFPVASTSRRSESDGVTRWVPSMRVSATSGRLRRGSIPLVDNLTRADYLAFFERVKANKRRCVRFVRRAVAQGKRVYVYGASTKGNTILQYYGLTHHLIEGAAERSPEKLGKYTVGTLIPIVSEEEARERADYFLVLPWAFLDEFVTRERAWRARGGRFLVPVPEFRVV